MNDGHTLEQSPHTPYKELTHQQEQHLRQQIYYFTPFVRGLYQTLVKERTLETKSVPPLILNDLKALTVYYAKAFLNGDFDMSEEQTLVDDIYRTLDLPVEVVQKKIASLSANAFNKTDGWVTDHLFGSVPVSQVDSLELPGGPQFNQGAGEGIMNLSQRKRNELVNSACEYIAKNRGELPVSAFGNVARGILDGAFIFAGLQSKNIPSSYHFYRVSSKAMDDKEAFVLYEDTNKDSWGITADSFTMRGPSVPLSIKMLSDLELARKSVYITFLGEYWKDNLPVEHDALSDSTGMLFNADLPAIQRLLPNRVR
ncbi:hypothetical protein COY90_03800 [Candidatus Roizmanbacteria bacterium CG_4_10_14_0_8_um_filter_39_9]|uniref:Uncharacterized protein n=1 Tax=Candidatus Roizmanbacteria bacterium CG_4_10_14_0_8_um_filter_39_9 TaxID=1974829 RepID=A0A2M7QDJ1_9BACT|nr:MAG: hypothetical protein COY90_03800 [Candidatus Roizmanbacteria bacterium CG_4_10_14_0_8_um_filter_39_9]